MPACNRINASVTVKELDQKQTKFNNTYFAFYKSAQIMKSTKSPTGFIDKLRGVSTEVRDAKYETNKENDENRTGRKRQGNSDTSCTAQKRRHSASLFNMGSQTSMATARTYEAPNSPLDSSNILIEDPNNLSDSLKGEFERKYGIRDNWTPQEGVCLPGSGNVRCRNNAENCKKIHFIGSHSQRRNQICDSFDSHRSRRNEASECLQRHPRCQADVEGKDEYVRQAQEDGLLRLAHNSLGAWPAAHSLQAFQQHWCDSRYSGNLHLRPCPNKLSPQ